MTRQTLRASMVVVLVAGIGSAGCYREVATIHLDQAQRLVVTRAEDAVAGDEVPHAIETEGGGQTLTIAERYRSRLWLGRPVSERHTRYRYVKLEPPAIVHLSLDRVVTVIEGGEYHRYALDASDSDEERFIRVEVSELRRAATVGAVVGGASVLTILVLLAVLMSLEPMAFDRMF